MRKILVILVVLFGIFMMSCDMDGGSRTPFEGRWNSTSVPNMYYLFSGNNFTYVFPGQPTIRGTFEYNGGSITFYDTVPTPNTITLSYELNNNLLTLSNGSVSHSYRKGN